MPVKILSVEAVRIPCNRRILKQKAIAMLRSQLFCAATRLSLKQKDINAIAVPARDLVARFNPQGWQAAMTSFENNYLHGYVRHPATDMPQFVTLCANGLVLYQSFLADMLLDAHSEHDGYGFGLFIDPVHFHRRPLLLTSIEAADTGEILAFQLLHVDMPPTEFPGLCQ